MTTTNTTTNDVQTFIIDGKEISVADSTARTNASTAQETANSANTAASNAQKTANEAKSSASTAQNTANTAQNTADTANSTANANKTAISTINSTKVVKTCTYDSTKKSLTVTTGNIGG